MSTAIVTQDQVAYSEEQRRLITDVLCKGASETEVEFFMEVSKRCRLDPFRRQIHAVKRYDGQLKREVLSFQVGIDGLRAIAARTGEYAGNDEPVFQLDDKGNPVKATCTVHRLIHGQRIPFTASVFWREYAQTKNDGSLTKMWRDRPFGQLGKCAEAAALRKAFPEESGGLYTEEELGDDTPATVPASRAVSMPATDEVTVPVKPVPAPTSTAAKAAEIPTVEAEVVTETPADPEIELLTDFLTIIRETKEAAPLTMAVNEQVNTFKNPAHVQTAKKAINKRSKELGLVWDVASKSFKPLA